MRLKNSLLTVLFVSSGIFVISSKDVYSILPFGLRAPGSPPSEEEVIPLLPEEGEEEKMKQGGTETEASSDDIENLPASSRSQEVPFLREALHTNEARARSNMSPPAASQVFIGEEQPKALPSEGPSTAEVEQNLQRMEVLVNPMTIQGVRDLRKARLPLGEWNLKAAVSLREVGSAPTAKNISDTEANLQELREGHIVASDGQVIPYNHKTRKAVALLTAHNIPRTVPYMSAVFPFVQNGIPLPKSFSQTVSLLAEGPDSIEAPTPEVFERMSTALDQYKKGSFRGVDAKNPSDVAAAKRFLVRNEDIPLYLHGALGVLDPQFHDNDEAVAALARNIELYQQTKDQPVKKQEGVNPEDPRHKAAINLLYEENYFDPPQFPLVMEALNQGPHRIEAPTVRQMGGMHNALQKKYVQSIKQASLANALLSHGISASKALEMVPYIDRAFLGPDGISDPTVEQVVGMGDVSYHLREEHKALRLPAQNDPGDYVRLAKGILKAHPNEEISQDTVEALPYVVTVLSHKQIPTLAHRDALMGEFPVDADRIKENHSNDIVDMADTLGGIDPAGLTVAQISGGKMRTERAADIEERLEELAAEAEEAGNHEVADQYRALKPGVNKWHTLPKK